MLLSVSLVIVLVCVVLDQVTKMLLMTKSVELIPNLLYFVPRYNDGAAFSSLSGERLFFIIFTWVSLIIMFYLLVSKRWSNHKLFKWGLSIMIGGVLGNFIDRIIIGVVRDFIYIQPFMFVCNVADICITVACIIIVVYIFFYHDKEEKRIKNLKLKNNSEEK